MTHWRPQLNISYIINGNFTTKPIKYERCGKIWADGIYRYISPHLLSSKRLNVEKPQLGYFIIFYKRKISDAKQ